MIHRVELALAAAALLGTLLIAPAPAYAKSCSLTADCPPRVVVHREMELHHLQ